MTPPVDLLAIVVACIYVYATMSTHTACIVPYATRSQKTCIGSSESSLRAANMAGSMMKSLFTMMILCDKYYSIYSVSFCTHAIDL